MHRPAKHKPIVVKPPVAQPTTIPTTAPATQPVTQPTTVPATLPETLPATQPEVTTMLHLYASSDGTGNCLTAGTPGTPVACIALAVPSCTIHLADGTYTGVTRMLTVVDKVHGTLANPITIQATNDGAVLIDGQSLRQPMLLSGVDYWNVEGINFRKSLNTTVARLFNCNYCQVKRCCAWDAPIDWNAVLFSAGASGVGVSRYNLFEDCCGFGKGRKIFSASQGGDYTTFRRCLGIWMGSTCVGPKMPFTIAYNNYHCIFENCVAMWTGEAMPTSYTLQTDGNDYIYAGETTPRVYTNYGVDQPYGLFSCDASAVHDTYTTLKGCIALVRTADRCTLRAGSGLFFCINLDHISLVNCAAYTEKAIPAFTLYTDSHETPTDLTTDAITGISSVPSHIHSAWSTSGLRLVTSGSGILAAVDGLGATIAKRYVDGVLTADDLWPWPMDARIAAALTTAGYTSFTLTTVVAGLGGAAEEGEAVDPDEIPPAHVYATPELVYPYPVSGSSAHPSPAVPPYPDEDASDTSRPNPT
jgi:hypothetical protein